MSDRIAEGRVLCIERRDEPKQYERDPFGPGVYVTVKLREHSEIPSLSAHMWTTDIDTEWDPR